MAVSVILSSPPTVHYYYDPFTKYVVADTIRTFIMFSGFTVGLLVLYFGHLRWKEDRHSATVFLGALVFAMITYGGVGLVALGRPPVWWFICSELIVEGLSFLACYMAMREAKRGVWFREQS